MTSNTSTMSGDTLTKLNEAGFSTDDNERHLYIRHDVCLGKGSFGQVLEAFRCSSPPRRHGERYFVRVAVKEISLDRSRADVSSVLADSTKEALLLERLRNTPHIVNSFTPWLHMRKQMLCFPMEIAEMNLDQYVRRLWSIRRRSASFMVPEGYFLCIAHQALQSLMELHSRQIIHRDVKMENFLVFRSEESDCPAIKLADFGLSIDERAFASDREVVGTPYFMAPECHISGANFALSLPRAAAYERDVWAFGCMIFFMVKGHLPFTGNTRADVKRRAAMGSTYIIAHDDIPSLPERCVVGRVEAEILSRIVMRCFEVDPLHRISVVDLLHELEEEVSTHFPLEKREALLNHSIPASKKLFRCKMLCRSGRAIPVYSELPKRDSGKQDLHKAAQTEERATPVTILRHQQVVLVEEEFEFNDKPAKETCKKGSPLGDRWAKIVYPLKGYCLSQEHGHHLLHPYEHRRSKCPPLKDVEDGLFIPVAQPKVALPDPPTMRRKALSIG